MAEYVGLEPTTYRLTADCSTIELIFQSGEMYDSHHLYEFGVVTIENA